MIDSNTGTITELYEVVVQITSATWHLQSPKIEPLCPVGSGDALLGAFCVGLERGDSLVEALQLGIAAGAANALEIGPGVFKIETVEKLIRDSL